MATRTYYQILESSPNASADELRSNYRKLAMEYHPDRNPGDLQAEERFKEINIAYRALSNPDRRLEYDLSLLTPMVPEPVTQSYSTPDPAQNRPTASYQTQSRPIPPRADTNKRPSGMTGTQIGVLIGTALFCLLIIIAGFMLLLAPKTKPASAAPRATRIFVANTPTATPVPVIATLSPPSDWVKFETKNATLWLPGSFVGGDLLDDRQKSINKVNALGPYFRNQATLMKTQSTDVVLWMVDSTLKQTDFFTFVKVSHFVASEDTSIDDYIQKLLNDASNGTPIAMQVAINQTKKLTVLGHEAKRLTFSAMYAGHELVYVFYFIKNGADVWEIDYYVTPQDYIDTLPIIEKSVQTFNMVP